MSTIKEYYEKCDLWVPNDLTHRQFRIELPDGRWIKLHPIRSREMLRRKLCYFQPVTVFYSTFRALDPRRVGPKRPKGMFKIGNNLFLQGDVVFDFDVENAESLEEVRWRALEATDILAEDCADTFEISHALFSGMKGFHVVGKQTDFVLPPLARTRMTYMLQNRKRFIRELPKRIKALNPDIKVLEDVLRFTRLPRSLHKSGNIAIPLTRRDLKRFSAEKILKMSNAKVDMPASPKRAMTDSPRLQSPEGPRTGIRDPSTIRFITNQAGKRHCPFLRYAEGTNIEKDCSMLQEKYGAGSFYVFKEQNGGWAVSATTFEPARLRKLYAASKAINKTAYIRYGKVCFPIDPSPEYVKIVRCKPKTMLPASQAHLLYLNRFAPCRPNTVQKTEGLVLLTATRPQTKV